MKLTLSEKKIYRQPTMEWVKLRIKSMIWNIRKQKKKNQPCSQEKTIQKNEDSANSLNFKRSNIHIIGMPEGEEKEQEIGNLFEKNNERKLP